MKNYLLLIFIISLNTGTSLINQMMLAHYFGAGLDLDILNSASGLPNSIVALSMGGLSLVMIPQFASIKIENESYVNSIKYFIMIITKYSIIIIPLLVIFQVTLYKSKIPHIYFNKYVALSILSYLMLYITLINSVYLSWANVEKRYWITSIGSSILNLSSIVLCYAFNETFGTYIIVISLLLGSLGLYLFYLHSFHKNKNNDNDSSKLLKYNKTLSLATIASIVSIFPFAFSSFIDIYILSKLLNGFVSYAVYANKLMAVLGLFLIQPFNIMLFPLFTKISKQKNKTELQVLLTNTVFLTLFASLFLIILVKSYSNEIIKLVFQHGHFSEKNSFLLNNMLKTYIWGIVGLILMNIFNRLLAALNEHRFQIFLGIGFLFIYLLISLILFSSYNYLSVAVAYALTWGLGGVVSIVFIYKKYWSLSTFVDLRLFVLLLLGIAYTIFSHFYSNVYITILILIILFIFSLVSFFNVIKIYNKNEAE